MLSAKHGLVAPETVLAPYDVTLADLSAEARERWGERIAADLEARHPGPQAWYLHAGEDAGIIEAFRSGHDFHSVTAARVFGVDPTDVTGEMRAKIKAMNYGLAYGLSAFGLSQQLRIDTSEARGLMDEYFETFGGVRDYLGGIVDEARRSGFTETIMGRRRYLPDLTSDNRQRREMAERMALNAPIQGSAADIIKVAMLNVDRGPPGRRGWPPGCCSRSTTTSSSRSPTASTSERGARPRADRLGRRR